VARRQMYETFDHTADLGLRIRAPDCDSLFAEAALALYSVIVSNLAGVRATIDKKFVIEGTEIEYLLFDWLAELLYSFESTHLLFSSFSVQVTATGLEATARGEPYDESRHQLEHEVKAITYHGLLVEQRSEEWLAELIVDI